MKLNKFFIIVCGCFAVVAIIQICTGYRVGYMTYVSFVANTIAVILNAIVLHTCYEKLE